MTFVLNGIAMSDGGDRWRYRFNRVSGLPLDFITWSRLASERANGSQMSLHRLWFIGEILNLRRSNEEHTVTVHLSMAIWPLPQWTTILQSALRHLSDSPIRLPIVTKCLPVRLPRLLIATKSSDYRIVRLLIVRLHLAASNNEWNLNLWCIES